MPINAENKQTKNFKLVPAGNHVARCYQMIEIGTEEKEIMGELKKQYTVRVVWELPNEKDIFDPAKGEQPFSIGKDYTLSMHEKANLRKDLQSWRGKEYTEEEAKKVDISKLVGAPCMLNVIHKTSKSGNTYATISGVTAIPKGFTCPNQVNPSFVFSYDSPDFENKYNSLPDWMKERIAKTPEFKLMVEGPEVKPLAPVPSIENDDLPF